MVTLAELRAAQERIRGVAVHTPLVALQSALWVKAEGLQPIGSFKHMQAYVDDMVTVAAALKGGEMWCSSPVAVGDLDILLSRSPGK